MHAYPTRQGSRERERGGERYSPTYRTNSIYISAIQLKLTTSRTRIHIDECKAETKTTKVPIYRHLSHTWNSTVDYFIKASARIPLYRTKQVGMICILPNAKEQHFTVTIRAFDCVTALVCVFVSVSRTKNAVLSVVLSSFRCIFCFSSINPSNQSPPIDL